MRLHDFLTRYRETPFEPGKADCAQFVRAWVRASTGQDFAADFQYSSLAEGQAALTAAGYIDHVDFVAAHLGEVHTAFARDGAVAVVTTDDGDALGILAGETVFALGPNGLMALPRSAMHRAFTCPK